LANVIAVLVEAQHLRLAVVGHMETAQGDIVCLKAPSLHIGDMMKIGWSYSWQQAA
jgi:hypothetical protein